MACEAKLKAAFTRACSHGSEGLWADEVPQLGGVINLSIQSLLFS